MVGLAGLRSDLVQVRAKKMIDRAFGHRAAQFVPPIILSITFLYARSTDPPVDFALCYIDIAAGVVFFRIILLRIEEFA